MIEKRLALASLQVEPEQGKLWLNAPNCVLRIDKLKFVNNLDMFSMIDVIDSNAVMIKDMGVEQQDNELMKFLTDVTNYLKFEIDNNEKILDKEKFLERIMFSIRQTIRSEYRD